MTAPTLTEFLLARYDECEAAARKQLRYAQENELSCRDPQMLGKPMPGWWQWPDVQALCARVLADCEAKRRIVEWAQTCEDKDVHVDAWCLSKITLAHLAAVYADHPDYDEAWRAEG